MEDKSVYSIRCVRALTRYEFMEIQFSYKEREEEEKIKKKFIK